jgi:hypothetical protein
MDLADIRRLVIIAMFSDDVLFGQLTLMCWFSLKWREGALR